MRTLNRTVTLFIVINLLTAGFALAQTAPATPEPAQVPAPSSLTNVNEDSAMNDLLVSMSVPSSGRGLFGSRRANSVLVIPNQEIKAEEILKINEDINVMSRIFVEKLDQERLAPSSMSWAFAGSRGMTYGFPTFFGRNGSTTGSMYLQGYGALFLMKVDFPLSAPPEVQEKQEEQTEKEDVDQVWQQTRQQMYEPRETSRRRHGRAEREEVKYDPEKVENLKKTFIQALKHATNIRILKPDESVVLSIAGSDISSNVVGIMTNRTDQIMVVEKAGGKQISRVYEGGLPDDIKFSSPTVLIIRAKKSDIDSFAKGDLNYDGFRQSVKILSYPLLGSGTAGTSTSLVLPSTGAAMTGY
jgi:hypothetical protein